MLRLTKLLVPPDLLSSKTAPCKRMNWACFWSSGCRTSRCSLYFWMSPNLPAEFFCKPPLPFVGKGCLHCILQVPLSASVYFPVSWMWQCCGLSWKQLPSLGPAPNLSFPFARDQGWNEKLHSYHPANAQKIRQFFCFCMCRDVNPYSLHWHHYVSAAWFWRITCITFQEAYDNFHVPVKLWLCLFTKGIFCTMIGVHDWRLRILKNFPIR